MIFSSACSSVSPSVRSFRICSPAILPIAASWISAASTWEASSAGCAVTVTLRTYRHGGTEHSRRHASSRTYYYATFQVESGDRMELEVPDMEYGLLVEGDRGRLTFQGTRFQGFRRT